MDEEEREIALHELTTLDNVISRHEDQSLKARSLIYVLLSALTVAYFHKDCLLSLYQYLLSTLVIVFVFLSTELVHRAIVRLAINRSADIQSMIRGEKIYDGPCISSALDKNRVLTQTGREFFTPWVWVHYIGLLVLLVVLGLAK